MNAPKETHVKELSPKDAQRFTNLFNDSLERQIPLTEILDSVLGGDTSTREERKAKITKRAKVFFDQKFANPEEIEQSDAVSKLMATTRERLFPSPPKTNKSRELVIHPLGYQENSDGTQTEVLF